MAQLIPKVEFNCQEKASSFIQGKKGDYCMKCNEHIHDLRSYSYFELQTFLNAQEKPICGKVFVDQLVQNQPTSTSLSWVAAGITSLLSLTLTSNGFSQEPTPPPPIEQNDSTHHNQQQFIESTDSLSTHPDSSELEKPTHVNRRFRRTKVLFRVGERYLSVGTRFPFIFFKKRRVLRGRLVNCEPF